LKLDLIKGDVTAGLLLSNSSVDCLGWIQYMKAYEMNGRGCLNCINYKIPRKLWRAWPAPEMEIWSKGIKRRRRLMHGVLVWWGNLWLESAISAEASGHQ
jgi:hypothetical protein